MWRKPSRRNPPPPQHRAAGPWMAHPWADTGETLSLVEVEMNLDQAGNLVEIHQTKGRYADRGAVPRDPGFLQVLPKAIDV